ncbi:hypothetical protein F5Y06DRAFT_297541 [Hypoxylon sp. FL0890]|nr:hypothetical protein F5Y06DRAFT_297541 [Hypoxylon sp. FL0890]
MARLGIGSFPMVPHMVRLFATISVVSSLALLAVVLRLYGRFATKTGFGWDDGFILISMAFGIGLLNIEGLRIGYPIAEVGRNTPLLLQLIAVHNVMFVVTIVTNKFSILCFYMRIFATESKIRFAAMISIAIMFIWGLISTVDVFAICHPEQNDIEDACNRGAMMKDSSALSIIGDIIVLLLPLLETRNLDTNLRTKIKIGLLYVLGGVITAISILRYLAVVRQEFESLEFAIVSQDSLAYAVLEANLGILCASLPMVQNLFSFWKAKISNHVNNTADSPQRDSHLENSGLSNVVSDPPIALEDGRYKYEWSVSAEVNKT